MLIPKIIKGTNMPKHLTIDATHIRSWAQKNNVDIKEACKKNVSKLKEIIDFQLKKDIPVLSLELSTSTEEEILTLKQFLKGLIKNQEIHEKKVRIYIMGDFNALDLEFGDIIKETMDSTRDYDSYFLNLLIKYDGQQEILTGTKLLLNKAVHDKKEIETLTLENIKDNLPSSTMITPDLMIMNKNKYTGLFLWNAKNSVIYYTNKFWLDLEKQDINKAIDFMNQLE